MLNQREYRSANTELSQNTDTSKSSNESRSNTIESSSERIKAFQSYLRN